jgi:hypothetical protein
LDEDLPAASGAARARLAARVATAALGLALAGGEAAPAGVRFASAARPLAPIVVAAEATDTERNAAKELARHLAQAVGASFEVLDEAEGEDRSPAIHVGPTRLARETLGVPQAASAETWFVRVRDGRLLLAGGRPRGTLYAVYHFLEDQLGVHWWTPWDETVPDAPDLVVGELDRSGRPAFVSRDVPLLGGPPVFAARSRINGHSSRLPDTLGGRERYGPSFHVHTFSVLVPPERWFETHPEFFSEVAGMRYGGTRTQLCLTSRGLLDVAERSLRERIDASRHGADAEPPLLWSVSQNDWGRPCACEACSALAEREGSQAAPLIEFVNALADRIAEDEPDVRLDTLAYHYTLHPPRRLRPSERVVLRVSGLYERDYSKPFDAPENAEWREALEGWAEGTPHLRVWDYTVVWGAAGELPLPNLSFLARDYRAYLALGAEGLLAQHPFPVLADLRDLKLWVQLKLLEDPALDDRALIRTFTDGYYGRGGRAVRGYVDALARAARRHPGRVGYGAEPEAYRWLRDTGFLRRAHRSFDRAEREVADDPQRVERVRHARLALDRATLVLWPVLVERAGGEGELERRLGRDGRSIAMRYRETALAEAERRLPPEQADELRRTVAAEVAPFLAGGR